ncbi:hypothetical protein ACFC08_18005 [Streptomyces sp. NPDC056112]|uniref:hypothetical protein n=1 Tax=Streptomyces sp. NPDC056112 TaxID=3345715 RepID=UPI0035DE83BC
MTTDQTDTTQAPDRELLNTLLERWQEVADAYKTKADDPDDDLARRYNDYRFIYLRNIRDLRHVLDTGRMPCSLMSDAERLCGDCGRNHEDEHDKHGTPRPEAAPEVDPWTWAEMNPAEQRLTVLERVLVGHVAEALIDSKGEEVRTWARSITHELRRAGIDLRDPIGARLMEIALGRLDEEHPF